MEKPTKEEFLTFLGEALMYTDEPLAMDQPIPDQVFDSTGVLMLSMALDEKYGLSLPLAELSEFKTPADVYEFVVKAL
ncbi:MAG: acyl carrier protein [Desulfovibrio sp.]|nr:acyl carrier protein [Desulfovibrio sp.]